MKKLLLATLVVSLAVVGCGTKTVAKTIVQPPTWKPVANTKQSYILATIIGSSKSGEVTNLDVQITKLYSTAKDATIFKINDKVEFKVADAPKVALNKGDTIVLLQNQVSQDGKSTFFSASIEDYELNGNLVDLQGHTASLPTVE